MDGHIFGTRFNLQRFSLSLEVVSLVVDVAVETKHVNVSQNYVLSLLVGVSAGAIEFSY